MNKNKLNPLEVPVGTWYADGNIDESTFIIDGDFVQSYYIDDEDNPKLSLIEWMSWSAYLAETGDLIVLHQHYYPNDEIIKIVSCNTYKLNDIDKSDLPPKLIKRIKQELRRERLLSEYKISDNARS